MMASFLFAVFFSNLAFSAITPPEILGIYGNHVPRGGQSYTIQVVQKEPSFSCDYEKVVLQLVVSQIQLNNTLTNEIGELSSKYSLNAFNPENDISNGTKNDVVFYLGEQSAGLNDKTYNFIVPFTQCLIGSKFYVYSRCVKRCWPNKGSSTWTEKIINCTPTNFEVGLINPPIVACNNDPFSKVIPLFLQYELDATNTIDLSANTSYPSPKTVSGKEVTWSYRSAPNTYVDGLITNSDKPFSPVDVNDELEKSGSLFRYTISPTCTNLQDAMGGLANSNGMFGLYNFVRTPNFNDVINDRPTNFARTNYLFNIEDMPCKDEFACNIRGINYWEIPSGQEIFSLIEGPINGGNSIILDPNTNFNVEYFERSVNGRNIKDGHMTKTGTNLENRVVCYEDLYDPQSDSYIQRFYRVVYNIEYKVRYADITEPSAVFGATTKTESFICTFYIDYTVIPETITDPEDLIADYPLLYIRYLEITKLVDNIQVALGEMGLDDEDPCDFIGKTLPILPIIRFTQDGNEFSFVNSCNIKSDSTLKLPKYNFIDPVLSAINNNLVFRWLVGDSLITSVKSLNIQKLINNRVKKVQLESSLDGVAFLPIHKYYFSDCYTDSMLQREFAMIVIETMEDSGVEELFLSDNKSENVSKISIKEAYSVMSGEDVFVYPNPVKSGKMYVGTKGIKLAEMVTVKIIGTSGKILFTLQLTQSELEKTNFAELIDLPSGTYQLILINETNIYSTKFLK